MQSFGRYEIIEQLGAGAMGAVYKARDPMMDRVVAIKTILAHAAAGPQASDYRERFFREARAAGRLSHPGIVTVFDVNEHEGTPFLVMEYIAGRTLQSILESGERFEMERSCDVGIQISEALDYAHKNGVIHRDIKPANILVTTDNRAKIADFGVAKLAAGQVTSTGQLLGTPAFMAPEQFTGSPIDGRADLFAVGVVLYWMATGDKPFTGDTLMAVSYKVVHTDPVPPRKLNPAMAREFEAVILKSMHKDPADRYQSGEHLAADLRALREGRPMATLLGVPKPDPNKTIVAGSASGVLASSSGWGAPPQPTDVHAFDTAETVAVVAPRSGISGSGSRGQVSPPVALPPAGVTQVSPPGTMVSPAGVAAAPPAAEKAHSKGGSKFKWIALIIIAIIVVGGLKDIVKTLISSSPAPRQTETQSSPADSGAEKLPTADPAKKSADAVKAAKSSAGSEAKPATVKSAKIMLDLKASDRATIVFRSEGQPTGTYLMKPGDSLSLQAQKEAELFTDNPTALSAKLNGREISFGDQRQPRQIVLTPQGIDEARSQAPWKDFENKMRELRMRPPVAGVPGAPQGFGPPPPGSEADFAAGGTKGSLGSPGRQRELAQMADSARVLISCTAMPEFVTIMVRVGNELLFRRDGRPPERGSGQGRAQLKEIPTVPLMEERFLPSGAKSFHVYLGYGSGSRRVGATQMVSGEFKPGQQRTLRIEVKPAAGSAPDRAHPFTVTLE
jgi:serine/threonine protein kinase